MAPPTTGKKGPKEEVVITLSKGRMTTVDALFGLFRKGMLGTMETKYGDAGEMVVEVHVPAMDISTSKKRDAIKKAFHAALKTRSLLRTAGIKLLEEAKSGEVVEVDFGGETKED